MSSKLYKKSGEGVWVGILFLTINNKYAILYLTAITGGVDMAHDTKVILKSLSLLIAKSKTVKEAYSALKYSASVEGMELPSYEEIRAEIEKDQQ
jgi:hypothetical protein